MRCPACDHSMPDPKPIVQVKEVEVDHSDGYYVIRGIRWAALVVVVLILAITGYNVMEIWRVTRMAQEPTLKFEYLEYDGAGRPTIKATR